MKILRIIARLNVGGPARHVVWLTEALQNGEFQSKLIAGSVPVGEKDMSYFASEHGVEPVYLKEMSRELSLKDVISLAKVYRLICREKPDLVHTHTAKAGTVGRIAAFLYKWLTWRALLGRPRRLKVVHTFHGHVFHSYYGKAKTRLFVQAEKILARMATDRIIVITQQQLREIHDDVGVGRREQFAVIPLGIELANLTPDKAKRSEFRNEISAGGDEILIGFVGRLTEIKNIPMLMKAAGEYFTCGGAPQTRFVIVGDGHLSSELKALAMDLNLCDRVVFVGNRDDIDRIYSGLDIVALTSLNEGTPLSLIEAMAAGRPVISTAVGGVVDLLGEPTEELDGFNICERGISVASGDASALAKGLIYLAKNERLRLSLGEKGRQFATKRYGKERLIEDIKRLYTSLSAA